MKQTLTYGQLPSFEDFIVAFHDVCNPNAMYRIRYSDTDAAMSASCGLIDRSTAFDCESLWEELESLSAIADGHYSHGEPWTDEQREWAGDFASSILATLGIEWV